ncbi:exodeoxyribonuclease VII large subunit [Patescibacteria group bacterium]|nr:exodeoxyribonuclease VII large subunit [Patescibacteria group bacterium]MBU1448788.1 exodeoxyribonuclease VII large subunit [Patescibacteria group bacterium]MBU2613519.1 exodeoxyribonuclease VII large subunit [Patescibacteria group bacterium]
MRVFQVSEFIETINVVLRGMWQGEEIGVEGEVSGFRVSQGQWVSFDLKDDKGLVNVFLPVWNLRVPVEDGLRVRAFGIPRIYPKYGKFSLSAERIELVGEGALAKALALLRQRLEKEGLFDPSRKRALPRFPDHIALIASRESAAYGDVIRVLGERWGGLKIDLYHVLVQGERAPQDIVSAIRTAQEGDYDVLVMTRGGGSLEELMAFNDERVVRAVHGSRIPTLVAIGHERDVSLAEEAADVRGSTPTDCARRLVPDRRDVLYEVATRVGSIEDEMAARIQDRRVALSRAVDAPSHWISSRRALLDRLASACDEGVRQWLRTSTARLQSVVRLLGSLDPNAVLGRGYAIVRDASGHAVVSVARLRVGSGVTVRLADGNFDSTITDTYASEERR